VKVKIGEFKNNQKPWFDSKHIAKYLATKYFKWLKQQPQV
jgi:hypothetical protein